MISKTVVLFVFGMSIASAQFMPTLLGPMPYYSGPAPAPVICHFLQPNLSFKPSLIPPATFIPPLVVEKCDTPQIEIKLPEQEHIVIPEAPILPPITVPKFPVPVFPMPVPPKPILEPYEPAPVAISSSAVGVPVAPVLTPLEMEYYGIHGADISEMVLDEFGVQSMLGLYSPAIPEPVPIRPLVIPPAPVLPPAPFPEIPVRVEAPAPPMVIEEPCITDVVVPEAMPIPMPEPAIIVESYRPAIAPMPILPPAIVADPCEPVFAPLVRRPGRPIVGPLPAFPAPATGPVLFPPRNMFVNKNMFAAPYMRRI